jgi:hypothetical protein
MTLPRLRMLLLLILKVSEMNDEEELRREEKGDNV